MKPKVKRNQDRRKELLRLIAKLDDANPQQKITKEKFKAQLVALDKKSKSKSKSIKNERPDKKPKKINIIKMKPGQPQSVTTDPSSQTNKTIKLPSESLSTADPDAQLKQNVRKCKTNSVAEVEHKISVLRRLIERRQGIHAKLEQQLELELGHVFKANEAMILLKKRVDDSFLKLTQDVNSLKARQIMDIKSMKEQLKCVEKQAIDNGELEKCARRMSDTMVKNQVSSFGLAILSPIIDAVKGVLYQLAKIRDAYKMVLRDSTKKKKENTAEDNKELAL